MYARWSVHRGDDRNVQREEAIQIAGSAAGRDEGNRKRSVGTIGGAIVDAPDELIARARDDQDVVVAVMRDIQQGRSDVADGPRPPCDRTALGMIATSRRRLRCG